VSTVGDPQLRVFTAAEPAVKTPEQRSPAAAARRW
jgi:hypothetical protein